MNVFGAFTFGSLIKTFLPGLVWLLAIGMIEADIMTWHARKPLLLDFARRNEQAAMVLAIPAAVLLGLLSNIVVFMGLNDKFVRNPVRRAHRDLFAVYDTLVARVRGSYLAKLGHLDGAAQAAFHKHADVELILLEKIGVSTLAYVREQYWFHLEFQVNLLASMLAIIVALVGSALLPGEPPWVSGVHVVVIVAVLGPACVLLYVAARKNYLRHVSKMLSLIAGAWSAEKGTGT